MAPLISEVFLVILVIASFVGLLSTAPSNNEDKNGSDYNKPWITFTTDVTPIMTTIPDTPQLECEKTTKKYDTSVSQDMRTNMKILKNQYNNWGKFLAPAPVAIDILGQLILMANQLNNFPINSEDSSEICKEIQQPKGLQTALLQISHRGYKAFLKAHVNMDAIRVQNIDLPDDIKEVVRDLATENLRILHQKMPSTLNRINKVIEKSQELSKDVVDEFNQVLELIVQETGVILNGFIRCMKTVEELEKKEKSLLEMKIAKMEEMIGKLEHPLPNQKADLLCCKQLDVFIGLKKEIHDLKSSNPILDKSTIHFIKTNIESVSRTLNGLGPLINHWKNFIKFFNKIKTFVESASGYKAGIVYVANKFTEYPTESMAAEFTMKALRWHYEQSYESVWLVHGITEMYVNVSDFYIMDRLAKLKRMNSMRIEGGNLEEINKVKENITGDAKEASQEMENYIQTHEKKLKKECEIRHKEIIRELRKTLHCAGKDVDHLIDDPEWTVDKSISNFAKFKIKSRINDGKVIEMSSDNQVRMWESREGDNQLWYKKKDSIIRSFVNDYCLTSNGLNKPITVEPCQENSINQKWTLHKDMIINIDNPDRCLVIHNEENNNGARIDEVEIDNPDGKLWDMIL